MGKQTTIILALCVMIYVSYDLARTLRSGRAAGRFGTITRQKRPERYWRYVYADCAALVVFAVILIWFIWRDQ